MQLIQTVTVGAGGAASIEFTSIPQTYTDLVLVTSIRNTRSATGAEQVIYFNGNTSNFNVRYLGGEEGTVASGAISSRGFCGAENANNSTASTFNNTAIYIPNYTSSTTKSFSSDSVQENNSTAANLYIVAGLWSTTDPVTSIKVQSGFTYAQYCSASLYGITKGSDGIVTVS